MQIPHIIFTKIAEILAYQNKIFCIKAKQSNHNETIFAQYETKTAKLPGPFSGTASWPKIKA